ncbi:Na+/H+ antiporter subunit D [Desulfitibacter alkalitolerans]|uniref:Na+/H+ antiporter subunit D n=1 Tax=Desulfitibacter alkalitolerans TaxID=264641 RepID=UPI00048736ED|nr:Na+/H+ antiporter subunit D [Desulfitibacter alkalitolerans]
MSNNLVIYPVLLPLLAAIIMLLFQKNIRAQKTISTGVTILGIIVAFYLASVVTTEGIQVFHAGNWLPPFGIVLVADVFAVIMVILSNIVAAACLFFSYKTIDPGREKHFYYPFYQLLMVGINGSFLTGDLFNLFVFFEIMLIASYILIVLGGEPGQLRESFKYVVMNMVSSVLFLMGLAMLYGVVGTLNMADAAAKIAQVEDQGVLLVISMIFLVVFGMKGSLFPLYFWLPQSYYEPPTAISALFGGLLTKVGVYALIRVFTLIFVHDPVYTHNIILAMGAGTMFFGVLGAIGQMDFKRILSYHIISQVGYMIMGLGLYTPLAIAGAIFYIVHHIIVKSCLFLLSGVTERITGTTKLAKMGGMLGAYPVLGWTFFLAGLSLAGVPPLSGFFSKFVLIQGGLLIHSYPIVFVAILVSVLTLLSMMKIFIYVFWGVEKEIPAENKGYNYLQIMPPALALVGMSIFLGLYAEWIMGYAIMAAEQLMNPEIYINSVLIKE